MFTIKQIKYFVMTVERGSVSAAAEALDMTPQAVSKGINEIEHNLKRSLFVRRASGLKPTPYGYALYQKARKAMEGITEFESFAEGSIVEEREVLELMLCTPKFACLDRVAAYISSFIKRSIDTETHVRIGSVEECLNELTLGSADGVVTIGETHLPSYEVDPIAKCGIGALMIGNNTHAKSPELSVEELFEMPIYLVPRFNFFYENVIQLLQARQNIGRGPEVQTLDMSLMGIFRALVRNRGCILVPAIKGMGDLYPGGLVVPVSADEGMQAPICLVTNAMHKSNYSVRLEQLLVSNKKTSSRFEIGSLFA